MDMNVQIVTGLTEAYRVQQNQSSTQMTNEIAQSQDINAYAIPNMQTSQGQVGAQVDQEASQEHDLIKEIEKANKTLEKVDMGLEFSIHEKTKQIMIKVINRSNNEIIREIPSEKILDMMASMCENAGVLVDKKI